MMQTYELGPHIGLTAPNFAARDHAGCTYRMNDLMGREGLILGFIGDIWFASNIRRIIWLQKHAHTFIRMGYNVALVISDQPHMLYGFYMSSPTPPEFPLLADMDGRVHRQFNMEAHPGMVLIDRDHIIQHKWLLPDERVWPKIQEIIDVLDPAYSLFPVR